MTSPTKHEHVTTDPRASNDHPSGVSAPIPTRGYALGPDEGVPGRGPDVKCSLQSTGGGLALYRTVVVGQGPPPHQHVHEDETIVVLDGVIEAECGDDTWTGGSGTTFFLPREASTPEEFVALVQRFLQ